MSNFQNKSYESQILMKVKYFQKLQGAQLLKTFKNINLYGTNHSETPCVFHVGIYVI